MRISFRIFGMAGAVSALVGLGTSACTTSDSNSGGSGGSSSTATGGSAGGGGPTGGSSGTSPTGTACAKTKVVPLTKPIIANFDTYDGASDLTTWSFPFGGDSSSGIFGGVFGYGDRTGNLAEKFAMTTGHSAPYALEVADTMAKVYGGGLGFWISDCLNVTAYTGISFWVRGKAPTDSATLSVIMNETTPSKATTTGQKIGTCSGTGTTCVNPKFDVPVTDTWTLIKAPWSAFTPGKAAGTDVTVDGRNIWQIQFDIGLKFVPGATASDPYVPVPAPYDLVVDDMAFY